jgi:hypothetical protein
VTAGRCCCLQKQYPGKIRAVLGLHTVQNGSLVLAFRDNLQGRPIFSFQGVLKSMTLEDGTDGFAPELR